jgi:hypothetical protein
MTTLHRTIGATLAASVLLLSSSSANPFVPAALNHGAPETPGVLLPGLPAAEGTIVFDETVAFSSSANPYNAGAEPGTPTDICFRSDDATVPLYLLPRYLAAGGTLGPFPMPNPTPFSIEGTVRKVVLRRADGGLDFCFQLHNPEGCIAAQPACNP